jgi:hypothetical protein
MVVAATVRTMIMIGRSVVRRAIVVAAGWATPPCPSIHTVEQPVELFGQAIDLVAEVTTAPILRRGL